MSAAGQAAVVRQGLGESHADARAERGSQSHGECSMRTAGGGARGKSSGEHGSQRGNGAVHQSGESWLYDLQNKKAAVGVIFLRARGFTQRSQFAGPVFVIALFLRQIVQQ